MNPFEIVTRALEDQGLRVVTRGSDRASAQCPAHEDRDPSLEIDPGDDRQVLLCCHAGCATADVVAKLGLEMADLFPEPVNGNGKGTGSDNEIVAQYDYVDEGGELLYQAVRFQPKQFRQRRPDGNGSWTWNLKDTRRVLYQLPAVVKAVAAGETVYVAEGEKDVEALTRAGVVATCNPMGAGKWRSEYSEALRGAKVKVVADVDDPGRDHAQAVARSLRKVDADVTVVTPATGKDASDHLGAGKTIEEFQEQIGPQRPASGLSDLVVEDILSKNPELTEEDLAGVDTLGDLMKLVGGKASVATEIVNLVKEKGVVLFHDPQQTSYASVDREGHQETHPVRSRAFRLYVRKIYYEEKNSAPAGQALTDALGVLEAEAIFAGDQQDVHVRVAADDGALYIDLGDEDWRAIAITKTGWEILDHHPVRFRRTGGMAALPVPTAGGSLDDLAGFVNIDTDAAWQLLVGWLLAAIRPGPPCPILVLHGEQGSAKSTSARVLRQLLDPSSVPLLASPAKLDDLMVSAASSHVVAYDNLSHLQPWLSDALCRLCTGGGISKRTLHTDADEFLLDAKRPVIINGIGELATRSDLLDRAVMLELPVIDDKNRMPEGTFWSDFNLAHAGILGGLCDALSCALAHHHDVVVDSPPRMADFAKWVVAAEPALGWEPGSFLASYRGNRSASHELAVEASVVGPLLREIGTQGFEGTHTALFELLTERADDRVKRSKDWPANARSLSSLITRIAPDLRKVGFEVFYLNDRKPRVLVLRQK